MMPTLTNADLKRLEKEFEPYVEGDPRILTGSDWLGLIARLEAAEKVINTGHYCHIEPQSLCEGCNARKAWQKTCGK